MRVVVSDSDGRVVELGLTAWDHVLRRHPDMAGAFPDVLLTIEHPTYREPDIRPGRERLFGPGGAHGWIRVVIEFQGGVDRVITAFSQSNDPRLGGRQ